MVALWVHDGEHAEPAGFVVVFAHPCDGEEVWELPDEHEHEEHEPDGFGEEVESGCGCSGSDADGGGTDHGGQCARDGSDEGVGDGDWFEGGVDEDIRGGGDECDECGDDADGEPEDECADDGEGESKVEDEG